MVFLFGYIKPEKPELRVREYEEYGGIYCTLCRRLGKDYGLAARLVLNYDCTFYAILAFAVSEGPSIKFHEGRCVANPLKKCIFCSDDSREFLLSSALTVILAYYKLRDDIADSGFLRKAACCLLYPPFYFRHRNAAKKYPELEKIVAESMEAQKTAEKDKSPKIDSCAEPTAKMLGKILEWTVCGELESGTPKARIANEFGYYLGRWVYLMDAADDIEKDIAQKSFNPFAEKFHLTAYSEQEAIGKAKNYANQVMNGTLSQLCAVADLMECSRFGPIVHNVVFMGLPLIQKEKLFTKENGNVRPI
jgi:hypothetical protein